MVVVEVVGKASGARFGYSGRTIVSGCLRSEGSLGDFDHFVILLLLF